MRLLIADSKRPPTMHAGTHAAPTPPARFSKWGLLGGSPRLSGCRRRDTVPSESAIDSSRNPDPRERHKAQSAYALAALDAPRLGAHHPPPCRTYVERRDSAGKVLTESESRTSLRGRNYAAGSCPNRLLTQTTEDLPVTEGLDDPDGRASTHPLEYEPSSYGTLLTGSLRRERRG
jgi:hypothetical protein